MLKKCMKSIRKSFLNLTKLKFAFRLAFKWTLKKNWVNLEKGKLVNRNNIYLFKKGFQKKIGLLWENTK